MTLTSCSPAAPGPSALVTYERLVSFSGVTYVVWATLAADLRTEAALHTGEQRQARLARAEDCDRRAGRRAPPGVAVVVRDVAAVRQRLARHMLAMADFVPAFGGDEARSC